ncbi:MAG: TA system VapC family ribonuclease toxin [Thermodesulfobacteriota bacterium]
MTAVDTNILVYAHREELSLHRRARARLLELAQGRARWAIPVFCLGEFIRVVSHDRLFDPPFTVEEACEALDRVLASPSLVVLLPGDRFSPLLCEAVREANAVGNLVFDAQIVALCREAGVRTLLTEDRDFARFDRFTTARL